MHQSHHQNTIELTSGQVRTMTVETLVEHFNLVVKGYKVRTEDIWNIVVAASAQGQTIESAANQLEKAPDPSTWSAACAPREASARPSRTGIRRRSWPPPPPSA